MAGESECPNGNCKSIVEFVEAAKQKYTRDDEFQQTVTLFMQEIRSAMGTVTVLAGEIAELQRNFHATELAFAKKDLETLKTRNLEKDEIFAEIRRIERENKNCVLTAKKEFEEKIEALRKDEETERKEQQTFKIRVIAWAAFFSGASGLGTFGALKLFLG